MDPVIETGKTAAGNPAVGRAAPDFYLPDLDGQPHCLSDYLGKIVLLNFWSAECPWAERADKDLLPRLQVWGEGVVLLTVASNGNEPGEMLQRASTERGMPLVLVDAGHRVADLYQAQTTPHFFIIDRQGMLRYMGAYDDVTFRNRKASHCYVCEAVNALLVGNPPSITQSPPYGCTIVRLG